MNNQNIFNTILSIVLMLFVYEDCMSSSSANYGSATRTWSPAGLLTNKKMLTAGGIALATASLFFYYQMRLYQTAKVRFNELQTKYRELKTLKEADLTKTDNKQPLYERIKSIAEEYDPTLKGVTDKQKIYANFLAVLTRDYDEVDALAKRWMFSPLFSKLSSDIQTTKTQISNLSGFFSKEENQNSILEVSSQAPSTVTPGTSRVKKMKNQKQNITKTAVTTYKLLPSFVNRPPLTPISPCEKLKILLV